MSPLSKLVLCGTLFGLLGFFIVYVMMDNHKCQNIYNKEGISAAFTAKGCSMEYIARSPAARLWIPANLLGL